MQVGQLVQLKHDSFESRESYVHGPWLRPVATGEAVRFPKGTRGKVVGHAAANDHSTQLGPLHPVVEIDGETFTVACYDLTGEH